MNPKHKRKGLRNYVAAGPQAEVRKTISFTRLVRLTVTLYRDTRNAFKSDRDFECYI